MVSGCAGSTGAPQGKGGRHTGQGGKVAGIVTAKGRRTRVNTACLKTAATPLRMRAAQALGMAVGGVGLGDEAAKRERLRSRSHVRHGNGGRKHVTDQASAHRRITVQPSRWTPGRRRWPATVATR